MLSVPESSNPGGRHFDAAAQILGILTLAGLAAAAIDAKESIWIAAIALALAIVSLLLFIKVEARKGASALVPLDLVVIPQFCGAVVATAGMTFGMYGVLFLLPLTWQSTGRLDATGPASP